MTLRIIIDTIKIHDKIMFQDYAAFTKMNMRI